MLTSVAVTIGVLMTLVLGVVPSPLLDLASSSALFLR
jgi:NADH-quinone oxidoreductase subunit N